MSSFIIKDPEALAAVAKRTTELFAQQERDITWHTDRLFARLMIWQWVATIAMAIWLTPLTWSGISSQIHLHVWLAFLVGGVVTSLPVYLAYRHPGLASTRHAVAVGQMLMSALLIHLSGGRIETHFHVFGSLAILAFYRDWRVLVSGSAIVLADHVVRGIYLPQSVYGVLSAPIWRSLEHGWWVIFEVVFLCISIKTSRREMMLVAERQAKLEALNENIERTVAERTAELTRENQERRQAEERLWKSQAQLSQAQQIARLGSWEWDILRDKVTWSEVTKELYGHAPTDHGLSMEHVMKRVHPDDLARVKQVMAEALRNRAPFTCDHRAVLPDGTERIIQGRGEIVVNDRGEAVKMVGTVQDVTEARRAEQALHRSEERLRQSQKMEAVGRLAGGVAHDFNNLLTVIGGYCALSIPATKAGEPLRKSIEEIQRAAERAQSLTGQLLAFSRKQVLQPRVLNLNEVTKGMEKMLRRLIGEDVELSILSETPLSHVKADPGQVEQVIMNMAVNARDAMPHGGKLTIKTANVILDEQSKSKGRALEPGRYVMLSISDNGVGMTGEVKSHLFEPFFTTKGVGKGTGLGLATCHGIISQSGGDIRVYSELNSGTTFKIYLPECDAPADKQVNGESPVPNGNESVLVVEDDASVRRLTTKILNDRGYRVQESSNAVEALEMIKANPGFDIVITDVIMPQMSGEDLRRQINEYLPQTKVLMMSGYTDDALAHHGVLDTELSFLEKPFSPSRLARKVREVLDSDPPATTRRKKVRAKQA